MKTNISIFVLCFTLCLVNSAFSLWAPPEMVTVIANETTNQPAKILKSHHNIFVLATTQLNTLKAYWSSDRGQSFRAGEVAGVDIKNGVEFSALTDSDGYVHIFWIDSSNELNHIQSNDLSRNASLSFKPIKTRHMISKDTSKIEWVSNFDCDVLGTTSYFFTVHLAVEKPFWSLLPRYHLRMSYSSNAWQSYRTMALTDDSQYKVYLPKIRVTPYALFLTFLDRNETLYFRRSSDFGQSFSIQFKAQHVRYDYDLFVDQKGTIFLSFTDSPNDDNQLELILSKSTDSGSSFSDKLVLRNNGFSPKIAKYNDRLVLCWADERDKDGGIFLAESLDNGESFKSPLNISNTWGRQYPMAMLADQDGIFILSQDDRFSPSTTNLYIIREAVPYITFIHDQCILMNTASQAIPFTMIDFDNDTFSVEVESSNPALIPQDSNHILISGTGLSRSLTITPTAQLSGTSTITIIASDGRKTAKREFKIDVSATKLTKVIIVLGVDPSQSNSTHFKRCTDYAYKILVDKGYPKENICYLSPVNMDIDYNGKFDDVHDTPTIDHLNTAIANWKNYPEFHQFILYMVSHGSSGHFKINSDENLEAGILDEWLDDFQSVVPKRVITIIDSCDSGSFLSALTAPLNNERINIASTKEGHAYFAYDGKLSFSFFFWTLIYHGDYLDDAFSFAEKFVEHFQQPVLDANGDGASMTHDDKEMIQDILIAMGKPANDMPSIGNICESKELYGTPNASFWVSGLSDVNGISQVVAIIIPPNDSLYERNNYIEYPKIRLSKTENGRYVGTFDQFYAKGLYTINFYAQDIQDVFSLPATTYVSQKQVYGDINDDNFLDLKDAVFCIKRLEENQLQSKSIVELVYILKSISMIR
jgi:hypothetical protein